ncbi:hypothetical protein C8Q78DRAFT_1064473 [Trametes maxima]|nr:hypothetical protein C8Q78DRAFT_1064473 [Trametes maxima]
MNAGPRGIWGGSVITPIGVWLCLLGGVARRRSPRPDSLLPSWGRAGQWQNPREDSAVTQKDSGAVKDQAVTQKVSGAVPEPDPARKESRAQS